MSDKLITERSLSEIMGMSENDKATLQNDDIKRDIKLQFAGAYSEITKRLNSAKRQLQESLMDVENFDINRVLSAEADIKNEENLLEILKSRFSILFPEQNLDILG